jgi:hypothetical protein
MVQAWLSPSKIVSAMYLGMLCMHPVRSMRWIVAGVNTDFFIGSLFGPNPREFALLFSVREE